MTNKAEECDLIPVLLHLTLRTASVDSGLKGIRCRSDMFRRRYRLTLLDARRCRSAIKRFATSSLHWAGVGMLAGSLSFGIPSYWVPSLLTNPPAATVIPRALARPFMSPFNFAS